jgi:hypothetical protein
MLHRVSEPHRLRVSRSSRRERHTRVENRSSWPTWAVLIGLSGLGAGRGGQQVASPLQFTA